MSGPNKQSRAIVERLLAGEQVFLPNADWRSIQKLGSHRIYVAARDAGKFAHFVQENRNGEDGLLVWVDGERGVPGPRARAGGIEDALLGRMDR